MTVSFYISCSCYLLLDFLPVRTTAKTMHATFLPPTSQTITMKSCRQKARYCDAASVLWYSGRNATGMAVTDVRANCGFRKISGDRTAAANSPAGEPDRKNSPQEHIVRETQRGNLIMRERVVTFIQSDSEILVEILMSPSHLNNKKIIYIQHLDLKVKSNYLVT